MLKNYERFYVYLNKAKFYRSNIKPTNFQENMKDIGNVIYNPTGYWYGINKTKSLFFS